MTLGKLLAHKASTGQLYRLIPTNKYKDRLGKEHLNKRIRIDNSPDFPLRGLTTCPGCSAHITGGWSTKKNVRYAYYKYQCVKGKCINYGKSIPIKTIHEEFDLLPQRNKLRNDVDPLVYAVYDRVWIQELNNFKAKKWFWTNKNKISELTDLARTAKNDILKRTYEKQIETAAEELEALEGQSLEGVSLNVPYRTAQKSYSVRLFEEFANQNSHLVVDRGGIEPPPSQCECDVLPLN